jgi:hypothetical protein
LKSQSSDTLGRLVELPLDKPSTPALVAALRILLRESQRIARSLELLARIGSSRRHELPLCRLCAHPLMVDHGRNRLCIDYRAGIDVRRFCEPSALHTLLRAMGEEEEEEEEEYEEEN